MYRNDAGRPSHQLDKLWFWVYPYANVKALAINPTTGYQESTGNYAFNSNRKVDFLKLASEIVQQHHEWPNIGDLCRVIGIEVKTFYNHLNSDEKFAKDWRELELHGEASCLSDAYALRKKNPMYMFGWLRAKFPEKYDPSRKVIVSTDNTAIKSAIDSAMNVYDAEIVGNDSLISSRSKQIEKSINDSDVKSE